MARGTPCDCPHSKYCDSQDGDLPPTRLATLQQQDSSASTSRIGTEQSVEDNNGACSSMVATEPEDGVNDLDAQELEDEHVHKVYDMIARHFSATRCIDYLL